MFVLYPYFHIAILKKHKSKYTSKYEHIHMCMYVYVYVCVCVCVYIYIYIYIYMYPGPLGYGSRLSLNTGLARPRRPKRSRAARPWLARLAWAGRSSLSRWLRV